MTATLHRSPPPTVMVGDSIDFLARVPSDYLTWTGSAALVGADRHIAAATCDLEGDDFHVYFPGQGEISTAAAPPGSYQIAVFATNGADRRTIAVFTLSLTPDLSTRASGTFAGRMLGIIERAIEHRLTGNTDGGVEEYSIEGMTVRKFALGELEGLRNKYSAQVAREQNPHRPIGRVKMAFTPSGHPAGPLGRLLDFP